MGFRPGHRFPNPTPPTSLLSNHELMDQWMFSKHLQRAIRGLRKEGTSLSCRQPSSTRAELGNPSFSLRAGAWQRLANASAKDSGGDRLGKGGPKSG